MLKKMFTVYDAKADTFFQPFCFKETGEAIRAFDSSIREAEHPFNKFPEDYSLIEIGVFDDSDGGIEAHDIPKHIVHGIQLAGRNNNVQPIKEETDEQKQTIRNETPIQPGAEGGDSTL